MTDLDDETLTAYHESGHAYAGYALGGQVQAVQLWCEADDVLPDRFGECRMNWGPASADETTGDGGRWHLRREILTLLAGPVAEMIYREEMLHPAHFGPWSYDWKLAVERAAVLWNDRQRQVTELESMIRQLHTVLSRDHTWPAIAALADELATHEIVEQDEIENVFGFWARHTTEAFRF